MTEATPKFHPGDLVEVKSADEILRTLDSDGTSDRLPFMPEMVQFCGKRYRVAKRVLKTCYYMKLGTAGFRKFSNEDVVLLEGVRCSGAAHDGCQKECMIFWREAWLRNPRESASETRYDSTGTERLLNRLKTMSGPKTYFCQASELLNATVPASRRDRLTGCFREVGVGNSSPLEMARHIARWAFWKARRKLFSGNTAAGNRSASEECHHFQPRELVTVKSQGEIRETLNQAGCNRGLYFMPDMWKACGKKLEVERTVEKIIVDGTGEMRRLRNTVFLKDSHCECFNSMAGCPRNEFSYWRGTWLRPVQISAARERNNNAGADQVMLKPPRFEPEARSNR